MVLDGYRTGGTIWASALIRQRPFSATKTGLSRILACAAVRTVFLVSGEFHGILHGSLRGHGIVIFGRNRTHADQERQLLSTSES